MRKLVLTIVFAITCASVVVGQAKLTSKDYAVYAHVLREIYKHNRETYSNKSEFVIVDKTRTDPELEMPSERRYRAVVKDFERKNAYSAAIERRLPRGAYSKTYYLVPQSEIDELNEKGRIEFEKRYAIDKLNPQIANPGGAPYTVFYQKYPEASGYYYLSRVGFSGQTAIVQVEGDLGWNGFSRIYILKKIKGIWRTISVSGMELIS